MPTWRIWFLAIRPKTLPAAIVPVWAGCVLAWRLEGVFHGWLALATLLGALFIQIATNFFNDVIDADKGTDTEKRLGPQRVTASGLVSREVVLRGALVMLLLASLCCVYLWMERGWWILLIGVPSLYLSYGYTGGPFPLAYRGMGEVFVILFFGLIAVGGTIFVQLGHVPPAGWILGLQIGFLSAVLIAVNNFRDLEEDREAGKNTIVVKFGRRPVYWLIALLTMAPCFLIILLDHESVPKTIWFRFYGLASMIFFLQIVAPLSESLKTGLVKDRILGLAAMHLIVFVVIQTFVMLS